MHKISVYSPITSILRKQRESGFPFTGRSPKIQNIMHEEADPKIFTQNVIACIWDFDRTLIPGTMQKPIFEAYNVDAKQFWDEVNALPEIYRKRGVRVFSDTVYLNHLISYVRNGPLKGLNNARLHALGAELEFYPGLPDFFKTLQEIPLKNSEYHAHDITLEHYIISNGLAEMVRGSAIAPFVENIYGCEFIENPCPPNYNLQSELDMDTPMEINQIGCIVDNTIKTRFLFEINKGCNKNTEIDVNAFVRAEDRRIPIKNMLYIADGPSDVPAFSVVTRGGGKTYAVYPKGSQKAFAQNDMLLRTGRIQAYGPADYQKDSSTSMWLKMHVEDICNRIVKDRENALASRMTAPPGHLHDDDKPSLETPSPTQDELFG